MLFNIQNQPKLTKAQSDYIQSLFIDCGLVYLVGQKHYIYEYSNQLDLDQMTITQASELIKKLKEMREVKLAKANSEAAGDSEEDEGD